MSGAALAVMREFPRLLCAWLCERFVVSVTLTNEDELYDWFRYWLARHPYSKRARSVWASLRWVGGGDDDDERPHVLLSPSTGVHFMLYRGRPMWLSRSRDTKAPPLTRAYGRGARVREQLVICTLGRDQRIVRQLLEEAVALETRLNERRLPLYVNVGEEWERVGSRAIRSMDSIILPEGLLEKIVADLTAFRTAADWYGSMGIPYRRGYLLHGPPGTGKSSLVAALAGHFNAKLYSLSLSSATMTDERLIALVRSTQNASFLLLEDVDAAFVVREKSEHASGITFSGLLNALDGVASKEGCVTFMSTNHLDRLDPALVRPGRADMRVCLDHADQTQIKRLFERFFPFTLRSHEFAARVPAGTASIAQLQEYLLERRDDEQRAIDEIVALLSCEDEAGADPHLRKVPDIW